jgi:transposase
MAEPHPVQLRKRVVESYEAGEGSYPAIARKFGVGEASVRRWVALQRVTGRVTPRRKRGGTRSSITSVAIDALIAQLRDPTAGELTAAFNRTRRRPDRVHVSSIKRALYRAGYVVKKSAAGRWSVCAPTSSKSVPPS